MASSSRTRDALPGVLKLPGKILVDIASCLNMPDLRQLSRVSRKLYFFTREYLIRHRYTSGLINLPNEIVLEIVQRLDTQKDRSRFARTSQRFYPIVMNFIVRHNIRHDGSSLLHYATRKNCIDMARKILHLGGDVNGKEGVQNNVRVGSGPLAIATYAGYEHFVHLYLSCGAKLFNEDTSMWYPLVCALVGRHEDIAIQLSQDLEADTDLGKNRGTLLACACENKCPRVVRWLLERNPGVPDEQYARNRSNALHNLLGESACRYSIVRTELLEDDYQIVMMLLQHGADPEFGTKRPRGKRFPLRNTCYQIATQHPDPRVRKLFWKEGAAPVYPTECQ